MTRASGVVLDVNETLFSLDALDPVFTDLGLAGQRDLWFDRTLRNGFALTARGDYRSFPEVARGALLSLAPERLDEKATDALLSAFGRLQPHPEVGTALARLAEASVPVVTLSVGNAGNVARLFERAGFGDVVVDHLSCEAVSRWKPAAEPYLHACERLGTSVSATWMIAAHAWDLSGAAAVGMRTAWISRLEGVFDPVFGSVDVVASDLLMAVDQILDT